MILIVRSLIVLNCGYLPHQEFRMQTSYSKEDQEFLNQLGSRIRELRTEKELSQEKLSFECGLDRTYIGSVERGERNIAVINLKKICTALNVSISELLNLENE